MHVVKCKRCPAERKALYVCETSRNLHTRMGEHANSKGEVSFLTKHMADQHEGMERNFQAYNMTLFQAKSDTPDDIWHKFAHIVTTYCDSPGLPCPCLMYAPLGIYCRQDGRLHAAAMALFTSPGCLINAE